MWVAYVLVFRLLEVVVHVYKLVALEAGLPSHYTEKLRHKVLGGSRVIDGRVMGMEFVRPLSVDFQEGLPLLCSQESVVLPDLVFVLSNGLGHGYEVFYGLCGGPGMPHEVWPDFRGREGRSYIASGHKRVALVPDEARLG